MIETRVSAKTTVEGQIPLFMQEEYPLFGPFLKQYYESEENFSSPITIVKNIDQLLKVGTYTSIITGDSSTKTTQFVDVSDSTIYVNSTEGWPKRYGLLKINDEIITYTSLGSTAFEGCIRGFSGITTYNFYGRQVSYETTENDTHDSGSTVENLSVLYLKEFFKKIKTQFLPGFENLNFYSGVKQPNLLIQGKDFYSTKGTPVANKILFKSLFGENVDTIKPQDYLIKPSANDYRLVKQIVVKSISGNPLNLEGTTLYQEIDSVTGITSSYGSISDIQSNVYNQEQYYTIDVDFGYDRDTRVFGSLFGEFKVHPNTKLIDKNNNTLFVDSTVGFPQSGSLLINNTTVTYTDKTNNQFLNCSNINDVSVGNNIVSLNYRTYGFDSEGNQIDLIITGVLEQLNTYDDDFYYYSVGDPVLVKSIGLIKEKDDAKFNSWKYNVSSKLDLKSVVYNGQYFVVETFDDHLLSLRDSVSFVNKITNETIPGTVERIISKNRIQISASLDTTATNLHVTFFIRRTLSKTNGFIVNNVYSADIQDVYDYNGNVLVTAPSLPSYQITTDNRKKIYNIPASSSVTELVIPNHNFQSGDVVNVSTAITAYNNVNYFVKKVDINTIKLSLSNSNIPVESFQTFINSFSIDQTIELVPLENKGKTLDSQRIVRKIETPVESKTGKIPTTPGTNLGILINGVEIHNYKGREVVYYGPVETIDVLDGGEDYDVINPPILEITDAVGTGATGNCAVRGSLKTINIIDGGFDFIGTPSIVISGGNGRGAKAEAKLSTINHEIYFNATGVSTSSGGFINLTTNTIGFSTDHKLNTGEPIIYSSFNNTKIGIGSTSGDTSTKLYLEDDSVYYASVINDTTIKIHNNPDDAILGSNEINITSLGSGNQRFKASRAKNTITAINIIDSGSGYENKKRVALPVGVNTSNHTISIVNHDYNDGEIVTYTSTGSPISGLSTSENYYVIKVDNDRFRLCSAGIGTSVSDFNYRTNQYVKFTSGGSGNHVFNYQPITVSVVGKVGVSRTDNTKYQAVLEPVFRGEITSIQITNGGTGYGSTDIINFDRSPNVNLNSGSGASVKPVVQESEIANVIVTSSGSGYNSVPNFLFGGGGSYAKLSPVIEDGKLVSVKVINGGAGFSSGNTEIFVESSGKNAKLKVNIKKWTVNLVEKYKRIFSQTNDDGLLISGIRSGLQYVNLFAPRKLRETLLPKNSDGSIVYNETDLIFRDYERLSTKHSPIIGWAYDGNPIYGPYGYSNADGGDIRALRSGYELTLDSTRPPGFDPGFFVEDYIFRNSGDLDVHNGRFCKTPDFPNGVYAYFCTINSEETGYDSSYGNYRRPVFPYVIGNTYKSQPLGFNILPSSNQDDFDLTSDSYVRNTYPYRLNNVSSNYEFIFQPQKNSNQLALVQSINDGSVNNIGIVSSGFNYKVGDLVVFDNKNSGGRGATASIKQVFEDRIVSLQNTNSTLENVSFSVLNQSGLVEGITTTPHGLRNLDNVNVTGISSESYSKLSGFYSINVNSIQFNLSSDIGTPAVTGLTTYLTFINNVTSENLQANDVLKITNSTGIATERLLVLSVDPVFNRAVVRREYDGTTGYAYSSLTAVEVDPRRFTYNSGFSTSYAGSVRRKIFFNPTESVAIGTVGSGSTITYLNGSTTVSKFIRLQSIYIENHGLQTGQKLIYSNEGSTPISVSNTGIGSFSLQNKTEVYVAKFSENTIGISTTPIGIGSTGGFAGIGATAYLLYFISPGSDSYHSFNTQETEITGKVEKNSVRITTKQNHNLNVNSEIEVDVTPGFTTSIVIKYNSTNRRLVANPKTFTSSGINTNTDTITISNHNYQTGTKLIYTSSNPATGLVPDKIYYVVKIDNNSFKLTGDLYETTKPNPNYVNITGSGSTHEFVEVNPAINIIKGCTVIFDLSDPSLSDIDGGSKVQSFDFDLYDDSIFSNKFVTSLSTPNFEVTKTGIVGVTNDAKLTLVVNQFIPSKLYYKLTPLFGKTYLSKEKSEIIIDTDVFDNNSINVVTSKYNGTYRISGIGSTTIDFSLTSYPEKQLYNEENSYVKYNTLQNDAVGSIDKLEIIYGGVGYQKVPGISSITSDNGFGSLIRPSSNTIGKIIRSSITTPGFDYPSDPTLKPIAELPQRLYVEQLYSITSLGLKTGGKNYTTKPSFVVVDSITGETKNEVLIDCEIENSTVSNVQILSNTKTLFGSPRIIAVNNSNGIGVTNIAFNSTDRTVTINLATGFSTSKSFPFAVGDRILIEGIGITSTGSGYNSSNYNYELFTLTGVTSAIGGSTGVLSFTLDKGTNPGEFSKEKSIQNNTRSWGRIVPESYLPQFSPVINISEFSYNVGEPVYIENEKVGVVVEWNPQFKLLKINNKTRKFETGEIIRGGSTDNRSLIVRSYDSYADFNVGSSNETLKEYNNDSGKLSTFLQVLQDGDYYQNFSYSLKSKVPFDNWDDNVDALTHTVGFKKFGDLQVESEVVGYSSTDAVLESTANILVDLIQEKDFDCYENYDFAGEVIKSFNNKQFSDQIYFDSLRLLDYTEFVSNRVLNIDDISSLFDDTPSIFNYSVVGTFDLTKYNAAQFYFLIKDSRYYGEKEIIIVNIVYDGSNGYLTAYGRNETIQDLGYFGFRRSGDSGEILFYPAKFEFNSYNISNISVNISDAGRTGIGTYSLGDVVSFASTAVAITSSLTPSENTIVSISTNSYSSAKILLSASSESAVQFAEVNVTTNGSNVYYEIFGDVDSGDLTPNFGEGIVGQVGVTTSPGNIVITFTPNPELTVNIRALSTLIGNTTKTGIGTVVLYKGDLSSNYVSIASSTSPSATKIAGFTTSSILHDCALYYVQIHDLTNNEIQFSELVLINDSDYNPSISEYATILSNNALGSFDTDKNLTENILTFIPNSGIDVEVRVYQKTILITPKLDPTEIDLDTVIIRSDTIPLFYEGTQLSTKKNFNLTHRSSPIFKKYADGSNLNVVNIESNTVSIPNHFFVTGEKIDYRISENDVRIGIATTTISGIGVTNLLPDTLYAVKVNDNLLQFAETPEKALRRVPEVLDITSVGIGTSHVFASNYKSNSKSLICIDNIIQNPIVSTSTTTYIVANSDDVSSNSIFKFDSINDFYARDLVKIDNEFLVITDIGIGGTNNVSCRRQQLGTASTIHSAGSIVTKYRGNYNIVDDTIYFVEAPHGDPSNPEGSSSFQGRIFIRTEPVGSSLTAYNKNIIFDDISSQFNGVDNSFELKENGSSVSGIVSSNSVSAGVLLINNIFQKPKYPATGIAQTFSYELVESSGKTNVLFSGGAVGLTTDGIIGPMKYDINSASVPRGGIIVSVGSTQGYGFQPLVSAGATAIVSIAGTIQSISIGNSGSGYRPGIQTSIYVSVATSTGLVPIGTASALNGHIVAIAITNPGTGYTSTNPPKIVIDSPLNYENIPLIYDSRNSGIGTEATVDVVVGYGNSVIDFTLVNSGYGYTVGNILTVKVGGTTGIPTYTSLSYKPFNLYVNETFNDKFNAWYPGQFVVLDDFDGEFDGFKKTFSLKENGELSNFVTKRGSPLQLDQNMLVFINDVLQLPGESYIFNGGSSIEFIEAPKAGDSVKVLFYKGSDSDVVEIDVESTIKVGDSLKLVDQLRPIKNSYTENYRIVSEINSVDSVYTNSYFGPGITSDVSIIRTAEWCKQKEDLIIDENIISKSREELGSAVYPVTNLIQSVGIGSTVIFVENVRPLFNYNPEILPNAQQIVKIIDQTEKYPAIATALVSTAGTITSIEVLNGGLGFSTVPNISISTPISGTTAIATCVVSGFGTISSISLVNAGSGYTSSNPPQILISQEPVKVDTISNVAYEGDSGVIVGVATTSIVGISTGLVLDFFIPKDSLFRDSTQVGAAITTSGIQTGYYFVVYESNIGNITSSINDDSSVIGIGSTYIDNIYQAQSVQNIVSSVVGVGLTDQLLRIITPISSFSGLTGLGTSRIYGKFSWGRLYNIDRSSDPQSFTVSGISTRPLVVRSTPMRSLYTS
jgi:hypothetical protein